LESGGASHWASASIDVPFLSPGSVYNAIEIVQVDTITATTLDFGTAIGGTDLNAETGVDESWVSQVLNKSNLWTFYTHDGDNTSLDTTDDNGHGLLYPNQKLYFNILYTPDATIDFDVQFRVYYKLKRMTGAEQLAVINQYLVQN